MKKLLFLLALIPVAAIAQDQTCRVPFTFNNGSGLASSTPIDNRQLGCDNWVLQYVASNVNPINMTVESSFATSTCTGAAYAGFGGTVTAGANPATNTTGTETRLAGYAPCMRVTITGTPAGNWIVTGVLYGFRSGYLATSSSPVAACPNPCPVQGTVAAGVAFSGGPVQEGGVDPGGLMRAIPVNTAGVPSLGKSATGADGIANTNQSQNVVDNGTNAGPQQVVLYSYNGTTWDRVRSMTSIPGAIFSAGATNSGTGGFLPTGCPTPNYTAAVLAAGATTTLISGTAAQNIRICSMFGSMAAAGTWQFKQGTGTNCGTGTATLTPPMSLATGIPFALGSGVGEIFEAQSGQDLCVTTVTGSMTLVIQYAKF